MYRILKANSFNRVWYTLLFLVSKDKVKYYPYDSESLSQKIQLKMANVVPIHKQDDKQNVKNYQPVSLLPIFRKLFERLIYNEMYLIFYRK